MVLENKKLIVIPVVVHHNKSHTEPQDIQVRNEEFYDTYFNFSFWPSCFFYLCTLLPITWSAEWTLLEGRLNNGTEDKKTHIAGGVSDTHQNSELSIRNISITRRL